MKTNTRSRIVEFIKGKGESRPIELAGKFAITPQAIHRHLRALVAGGFLETRGRGPKTRYVIAGAPALDRARRWFAPKDEPEESPSEFVCGTRDVFSARLGRLGSFAVSGLQKDDLPLVVSAAGEIGNNCFDHNLGHWRDVPGCWLEAQATGHRLWICIADRGQGVYRSLSRVIPKLAGDQAALEAAFEKRISGRAPESRGNGLKFVKNIIAEGDGRGLACRSGAGLVDYGGLGRDCRAELSAFSAKSSGTVTLIAWSLK